MKFKKQVTEKRGVEKISTEFFGRNENRIKVVRFKPLKRMLSSVLIVLAVLSSYQRADATIVNAVIPDSMAINVALNDAVVNCDMAKSPTALGIIKAIVYGDGESAGGTPGSAGIFVEDFYGNKASINLPTGAVQPDVAIANTGVTSSSVLYQVVVAYCIGKDLYVDKYDLNNVGFSTFSITAPTPSSPISSNCNGYPHIDMWADNGLSSYGGSMHEFAVVWSDGSSQSLYCYRDDVTNPFPTPAFSLGSVNGCRMPDVVCFMDVNVVSSTFTNLFMLVTYGKASSLSAPVNQLLVDEFNASAGYFRTILPPPLVGYPRTLFTGTPYPGAGIADGAVYAPRIEAEGLYGGDVGQLKYQVVADIQPGVNVGPYTVMGFNDTYPTGFTLSSSQFNHPTDICMASCVAAGIMASNLTTVLGNNQYTAGFWRSNSSDLYARDIAAATTMSVNAGDIISPTSWFEVNLSSNPIGYTSQIAKNFALSNCSNEGDDLLAAWYDGNNIMYKYITTNPMVFLVPEREKGPATLASTKTFNELFIRNPMKNSKYAVLDAKGIIVLSGKIDENGTVNTSELRQGNYMLRILGSNLVPTTLPFNKI